MTGADLPTDFLDRLDAAVMARDGTPEHGEIRFRCPADGHPDRHPSARWNRAKGVWCCDACGAGGGAFDLADRLGIEKPRRRTQRSRRETVKGGRTSQQASHESPSPPVSPPREGSEDGAGDVKGGGRADGVGLTLAELAEAKKLPIDFLRKHGVKDELWHGEPRVVIPYQNQSGEEVAVRRRFRLDKDGRRFSWRADDKVMLYGLHQIEAILTSGWVLLVEGESDCWTCWHHGVPALGIPGKSAWKADWADLLDGLDVYLWQEPDADDLSKRVMRDVATVRVIVAPEGTKDISEAHCRGEDVPARIAEWKASAITADDLRRQDAEAARAPLREQSLAVLTADDPLALVKSEIGRLGYGGDRTPALIAYLALTTRLLGMRRGAMPAHLLLLGPPAAGKSYTLGTVLLLLPAAAYHTIDAGSPRVLIYDDADLTHRAVIFSEADSLPAGEDNPAASALRNLLQDHKLHYKVTIRDPETGAFTVHDIEKPGPTLLVTTAVKSLGSQLMTRLFALPVPEDVKRLQEALDTQATIELDGAADPDEALIAFQAYLQTLAPWDVVVPFARELSTAIARSANATRILRDFQRLLSLIKAVTILRHHRRDRNGAERWVATINDYRAVYDLVGPMFEATISGKTETVKAVVTAVRELAKTPGPPITYSAVARKVGMHPEQVKRAVETAVALEWLTNDQDKPNKPARLRVGEPMPETAGLPTPEALAAAFTANSPVSPAREAGRETENPHGDAASTAGFTVSHVDRMNGGGVPVVRQNGAAADEQNTQPVTVRSGCETVKGGPNGHRPLSVDTALSAEIVAETAAKYTVEEIRVRVTRSERRAALPGATASDIEAVNDWRRILAAKMATAS